MQEELINLNQTILRKIWFLDIGCTCQAVGFETIVVNLILIGVTFFLIYKIRTARQDPVFPFLLFGFILLGLSEIIDWWQSLMVSRAGFLVFYPKVYTIQELLRIGGLFTIFVVIYRAQKEYIS
jgi:hypothetical protein